MAIVESVVFRVVFGLSLAIAASGCGDSTSPSGGRSGTPDVGLSEQVAGVRPTAPGRLQVLGDIGLPDLEDAGLSDVADVEPDVGADLNPADLFTDSDSAEVLDCSSCHGGPDSPAPPASIAGAVSTADRGVGAHREHLGASDWHGEVACDACHRVPDTVEAPGHIDAERPADLVFGELAREQGAAASFDGERCANVYCHGATLDAGGSATRPLWTRVDGTQAACDSCHGNPPAAPHPDAANCADCHRNMAADGSFVEAWRHIDGQLDLWWLPCDVCHGSAGNPAPPRDIAGHLDTSARGVGAHREHLGESGWHREIECAECHRVPELMDSPGHRDSALPAELDFGVLATTDGADPDFDGARCASVYCHGATLDAGGGATEPLWTVVDGTQIACDSCHGAPPSEPHPDSDDCAACHSTADEAGGIALPEAHIDGLLQLEGFHPDGWADPSAHGAAFNDDGAAACTSCHGPSLAGGSSGVSCESCHSGWQDDCLFCHGGLDNLTSAPPEGVDGEVARTLLAVGAHTRHVEATDLHLAFECESCHVVPATTLAAGHVDGDGDAEVVFDAFNPTGSHAAGDCSSLYCHGATLAGGTLTEPLWTVTDGSPSACGSCHGAPPPTPHPASAACSLCHPTADDAGVIVAPSLHVDGILQVDAEHPAGWADPNAHGAAFNDDGAAACTSCHGPSLAGGSSGVSCESCHSGWQDDCLFCHGGLDNLTGAPPEGVAGEIARTLLAVGAHTLHVEATDLHGAWDCTRCHVLPDSALSVGHIDGDGVAELDFDSLNGSATYSGGTGGCGSTYCHGTGRSTAASPDWDTNPTLLCSSCHDDQTVAEDDFNMSGEHDKHVLEEPIFCTDCHNNVVDQFMGIVAPQLHVDGTVQISLRPGGISWNGSRCAGTCHGKEHENLTW